MFPVAMRAAEESGIELVNMAFCIMLGASASFMSPFGYQTNLMVYGPGGYRTTDFLRFGTPLNLVLWVWSILLLSVGEGRGSDAVFLLWLAAGTILLLAVALRFALWQHENFVPLTAKHSTSAASSP